MTYLVSPFNGLNQFSRELNRFFDDTGTAHLMDGNNWSPHVDVSETADAFKVAADVPGVPTEDLEISLHNGVLTIRGERALASDVDEENFSRRERTSGTFVRQFNLPDSADQETVTAKSVNGVLEISIPKATKAEPVNITVEGE
jgi:HSP20 family protein